MFPLLSQKHLDLVRHLDSIPNFTGKEGKGRKKSAVSKSCFIDPNHSSRISTIGNKMDPEFVLNLNDSILEIEFFGVDP